MKTNLIRFATRRPLSVYLFTLGLAVILGAQIPRIAVDTDPENMLPSGQIDRVFHNEVKKAFSLHDAIVVGITNETHPDGIFNSTSLAAMNRLTEAILGLEGVVRQDLMALGTVDNIEQAGPGTVSFGWLMRNAPRRPEEAADVAAKVRRLPLLMNTLVSEDGRAAAIYVPIQDKNESHRIATQIQDLARQFDYPDALYITGLPVAEDTFGFEMFVQMGISAPLAALVIVLLMWLFFRSWRLVIAPMVVAMVTVIATMGLLIGLGFTVHIMSSMIPIFLMPIAVVDSIHIMSEFADTYVPGADRREVVKQVVSDLFRPMAFTSITSAIGFLSLALTPIPPVQVFGVFVAFGIGLAFLLTIVFIPAYIVRTKPASLDAMQRALHHREKGGLLARLLPPLGRFSLRRAGLLISLMAVLFAVSVAGIARIQINDNPVRWFKSDHPIRVADRVLNRHFAGTYDAFLVLSAEPAPELHSALAEKLRAAALGVDEGEVRDALTAASELIQSGSSENMGQALDRAIGVLDDALWSAGEPQASALQRALAEVEQVQAKQGFFLNPEALRYVASLQEALNASGLVGKSSALPDLVKTINRELVSGAAPDYRLPDSRAGVAQALLQFQSSHRPGDLWHMVTPDYQRAVLWLQLKSGDNQDMVRVMAAFDEYLQAHPLPAHVDARWAGKSYLNVIWQRAMVSGMLKSLIGAFVVVLAMMMVLFRSWIFGLVAMLPLTLTITLIYGLIGWLGKDYDMPIAVLSALTLGLSIDFAIHFLERSRAIFAATASFDRTMEQMFQEPSRAISRNAIVIAVGFLPLLFAPLVPYITVGVFLACIMAISGLATLLILPATARFLRPRMYPAATPATAPASNGEY